MNVVEKILAARSGKTTVAPDDVVVTGVDVMVMHDLSANFVMKVFENEMSGAHIANPDKIVFAFDHNFSPATREAAEALAAVRKFAARHKIRHLFDSGCGSIHHVIMEAGLVRPGMIIVGCDSHTPMYGALGAFATGIGNNSMAALGFVHESGWFKVPHTMKVHFHGTMGPGVMARDVSQYMIGRLGEDGAIYKALEYAGPYIESLSVIDRCLFPLQAIDVGGKCGYINPDEKTAAYVRSLPGGQHFELFRNDADVRYSEIVDIDVSKIEPQVACPPTVGNVKPIDAAVGTPINVAEAGGSTGGRLSDIRTLAKCFVNAKVHPGVRLQSRARHPRNLPGGAPGGLVRDALPGGRQHLPGQRGSNQAFNMGALAEDEVMISTQARNFPGRNGHPKARHFLGSALTVAASAINGKITDPRSLS